MTFIRPIILLSICVIITQTFVLHSETLAHAASPAVTLSSELENLVKSSDTQDKEKGALVMITASYCVICKAEEEKLQSMKPWFDQHGLQAIIISLDGGKEASDGIAYIDASDSALQDILLSQQLDQLPMAVVIDSNNKVVEHDSLIKKSLHIVKEGGLFGKENLRIIQEQTNDAR